MNDWRNRHAQALYNPVGMEVIGRMVVDWEQYAIEHQERFESRLKEDYLLGPAWAKIGEGLLTLLNGNLGRLDGGLLDGAIRDALREAGFDPDTMEVLELNELAEDEELEEE